MTKTSHSKIYSTESGITGGGLFKTPPLHFTKEQLEWIENIQIPKRLFLISATEFDDRYLYLHDDWRYRFSGNNVAILFSNGKYFCDLSPVSLKLLKYLTIAYINENSASVADKLAQFVATTFKQIEVITRESLIEKMQMLVAKTERNHSDCSQFYYTLYALRKLDRSGFFESKDDSNDFPDEWIEQNYLEDIMFSGSGGSRNDLGKSIRNSIANFSGHKPKVIPVHKQKNSWYFTKEQLNDYVYQRYAQAKNFEPGHQCIISAKNNGDWVHFNYEDLMFIMPEGAFGIGKDFVSLQHIFPLDENSIEAWLGGTQNRKSIFDHFNLFEDDGSRVIIKKHVPRHNINTFLAIAGVTDHIQAILMGRVDITQNKHYQHQAESQSYQTASLAINMLEKAYDENNQALTKSFQLSLFTTQQKPCIPVNLPSPRTEVSRRMAALSRSSKTVKNTGVANVKLTTSLMINPELNTEHNLKQNMQTFGETTAEVVDYITGTMSDNFLPELKRAHDKLVQQNLADKAKSLLQRHAKLHPLGFGACTRDVARWGCPHALKCQSGLPCGYFTLTGRLGEAEEASRRLSNKRKEIIQLRKLTIVNPGFMLALKEQEEALIVLEALEADAINVQGEKKLVSLFSDDLNNPLYKVIERINKQMLIGKTPKTLADLFFIEQKRIERNNNG
ncbi:TPA: hypothetical protein ACWQQF_003725 [Escherichia coli]